MGIFSKLMGKTQESAPQMQAVEYNGYQIRPAPKKQGGNYVTAGSICKTDDSGELQEFSYIRADTHTDYEAACQHAVFKGKQIINEKGDRIFDKD